MRIIIAAIALAVVASPAAAQAIRITSDKAITPTQDIRGCKADDAMWWCYSNRKAPEKRYSDEKAEIMRVDRGVRAKFTYKANPSPDDLWASGNRAVESGAAWTGDCDDLAFTALDYMAWDGFPPERMWRVGMVIKTGSKTVSHAIGVVQTADGKSWVVGDVNRPAYPLEDFKNVYNRAATITYVSRLDQGLVWKPAEIQ